MNLYNDYLEKARDLANQVYDQGVKALSKTETERRLAEALSHANWGASTTLMGEIAQATNDTQEHEVIMREIWAACASTGRNWRVCYKGLALLEFLLKNGHKRVIDEAKENRSKIRRLETFSYLKDGVEKGGGVREKAKAVTELLDDDAFLKRERAEAAKLRAKFTGVGRDGQMGGGSFGGGGGGANDSDDDKKRFASSDSDDDSSSKKKKNSKSKKKGSDDDEASDEDEKPSKSKSKKKSAPSDDDDDDFPSTKSKSKAKKKSEDEDDDFSPSFSAKSSKGTAASKKKNEDDDVDFGFSDDDSSSKTKPAQATSITAPSKAKPLGPIGTISVKLPGAGSTISSAPAATKAKKPANEVDLLGGFDPFGTSSSAQATGPAASTAKPQQASTTADIMGLFGAGPQQPAAPTNTGFGAFPAMSPVPQQGGALPGMMPQQPSFPGLGSASGLSMPSMYPPMSPMGMPPMMMGQPQQQQQQPKGMMMGGGGMMMPQQPMMGGMMQQPMLMQQQPMMGMPMMGGPPRPMMTQQQQAQPAKKQDAFSGLMDFGAPMGTAPPTSKAPPPSLI